MRPRHFLQVLSAALLTIACLPTGAEALECFACRQKNQFEHNVVLPKAVESELSRFPLCINFNWRDPVYIQECPTASHSCVHIVDTSDAAGDAVRTCFPDNRSGREGGASFCTTNLCNKAWVWSGAASVSAAASVLAAASLLLLTLK